MNEIEAKALIAQGDALDNSEAAHADAAATGQLDGRGQIVPPNPDAAAMEWMLIPEGIAFVICGMFPEVAHAYTDEAKLGLARAIAPVAEKYGWNGPGDSPELMLAVSAFGFSMPAIMAYRQRKVAAKEKPEEDAGQGHGSQ